MLPESFLHEVTGIAADRRTGAAKLAIRAARALVALAAGNTAAPFPPVAEAAARAIAASQPSMAPMLRLANDALWASENRERFIAACRAFASRLEAADDEIATRAARLIDEDATVFTHSFSQTVLRAFRAAHQQRRFRIIATESRPLCEGVELARELAQAGIEVALVIDAAAARFMEITDIVLTGADAVTGKVVVNKIGTTLLALAARRRGAAVYALCSTLKIAPPGFELREAPRPAAEIVAHAEAFDVWNYYFEATPLDLFAGVVTEDGVLTPADISARSAAIAMHPALRR
jgi:ribose 1,5-bisphosphate isomerase